MAFASIAALSRGFKSVTPRRVAGVAFIFAALGPAPALADTITNLAFPSNPAVPAWSTTGASSQLMAASPAPDGSLTATVVQPGIAGSGIRSGGFPVASAMTYTVSVYVRKGSGGPGLNIGIGPSSFGGSGGNRYLVFDGFTGAFTSLDPALADYSIAPVGQSGWWRVSVTFKPTSTTNANLVIAAVAGGGQMETWCAQLETGPYQSRCIPTTTASASGENQINPRSDSFGTVSTIGRASVISPPSWVFASNGSAQYTSTTFATKNTTYYAYMYVKTENVPKYQTHPYLRLVLNNNGSAFAQSDINADIQSGTPLIRDARFQIGTLAAASIADQGVFDAGDYWVYWAKAFIGDYSDATETVHIEAQSFSANVVIGRVGLQQGGVFP